MNNNETDKSEGKFTAVFNSARDGVVILDRTGKIIQINDSLIKIGGYSREDLIGKRLKLLTMFTPKSLMQILTHFVENVAGKEVLPYEVEAKTKYGPKMFGEISSSPLIENGKIIGVVAIIRDITERRKIEYELKNKNEELEKFNKIAVGRELRMVELKNKIKKLEEKLNTENKL